MTKSQDIAPNVNCRWIYPHTTIVSPSFGVPGQRLHIVKPASPLPRQTNVHLCNEMSITTQRFGQGGFKERNNIVGGASANFCG
jgi:hypothetical protein